MNPDVTLLLEKLASGDQRAADLLFPALYDELRRLADAQLKQERPGHTLQTTALVNEVYLKLVGQNEAKWQNRSHFFAVASQAMRRILVNHALHRKRQKRGGGRRRVELDEGAAVVGETDLDLVALDEALTRLSHEDQRKAKVVELRYFAGMSVEDVAEHLGVATATVKRDWSLAKTWLLREISKGGEDDAGAVAET